MERAMRVTGLAIALLVIGVISAVPTAAYQPQPPMLVEGIVYVDGERAENGILVEAAIDDEIVTSFETVTTEGQQGYYIMRIDAEEGDEILFYVEGEEAEVLSEGERLTAVPYQSGFFVADLVTGSTPPTVTLTMAVNGNGRTVPAIGQHTYPEGAQVRVGAVPDAGWQFDGWSGDVLEPDSVSTQVVLDGDRTVTASFTVIPFSTPTPTPVLPATDTPEPSPTVAPTSESSPTPGPTETPGPSPTGTEGMDASTPESSPVSSESGDLVTSEPSVVPVEAGASPTPGPSPTAGAVAEGEAGTEGEAQAEAEDTGSAPTLGADGDQTPAPASQASASSEEQSSSEGDSGLLVAAAALAVLGVVAVGFGVYGLRQKS